MLTTLLVFSPGMSAAQETADDEAGKDPGKTERASHELGHVLQQREGTASRRAAAPAPAAPATRGDPDRPVVTGRAPNPASSGDRPTETLSLNYEKVRVASVKVKSTERHRARVIVRGWDSKMYALPDGAYSNDAGQGLIVANGAVRGKPTGGPVMKGKKILQNLLPEGRFKGPGGAWIEVVSGEIAAVGGQLERRK